MPGPADAALAGLVRRINATQPARRGLLVAIHGPPASGKSTFAADLTARLGPAAALVAMDGFHLDNRLLATRGLMPRKGAPDTFDATGFVYTVRRLAEDDEVVVPIFDRARDLAIAGAASVGPAVSVVVAEGNYLLLKDPPWASLHALWDLTVSLDVAEDALTRRLVARWTGHGLSKDQALARAQANDLPNARLITERSVPADVTL